MQVDRFKIMGGRWWGGTGPPSFVVVVVVVAVVFVFHRARLIRTSGLGDESGIEWAQAVAPRSDQT